MPSPDTRHLIPETCSMNGKYPLLRLIDRHPSLLAFLLLLLFFIHVVSIVPQKSLTIDEPASIAVGYAYLKTGDVNLGEDTPPLVRLLSALPLLLLQPQLPVQDASWQQRIHWKFGNVFFDSNPPPLYLRMVFWSRVPMILMGVVLGWLLYFVTLRIFGVRAALATLFLFTLEPNILANTMLVKTDVAAAAVYLWFFFAAWLYLKSPTWRAALHIATVLAVGLLTKLSLLLLPVLAFGVLVIRLFRERKTRPLTPVVGNTLAHSLAVIAFVVAIINLGYGLEVFRSGLLHVPVQSSWARFCAHFLPTTFLVGVESVFQVTAAGWPGFLAGKYSTTGWWYYYPVAMAVKLPVSLLICFTASLLYCFYALFRRRDWRWLFPLLPLVIYLVPSLDSKVNAGLRHLLPAFPWLLMMSGAWIVGILERRSRWLSGAMIILLLALPVSVIRVYPDYLAYFNEFAGGPNNGWKYLSDSNLDWGEELPRLAHFVKENHIEDLKLAYLGGGNPAYYGIQATELEVPYVWEAHHVPEHFSPAPGTYAISVTFLQGAVFGNRHDYFEYFRSREPWARLGGSIFVYKVG
jgi:hypothetical protein